MGLKLKKRGILPILVALTAVVLLVIAGCGSQSSVAPKESEPKKEASSAPSQSKPEHKPITIRMATAMPTTYITSRAISEVFIPEVEKNSNGLMKVEFYPAGQLFVDKDLNQAVVSGAVEMMSNTYVWWSNQDKSASFFDLPFLFKNTDQYKAVMAGKIGAELAKIVDENGAKFLGWANVGWIDGLGFRNKPVKKPEDMKGLKVRTWGDLPTKTLEALGASSVAFSSSEVYMALQRGTVDGAGSALETHVTRKWMEVEKYLTVVPLSMMSHDIAANPKWWNSLTPEQQKIIQDAVKKTEAWFFTEIDKVYDAQMDTLKKAGLDIYVVPPEEVPLWQAKVGPAYDYYEQQGGERAARLLEMVKEYTK